jgi:NTE family protein
MPLHPQSTETGEASETVPPKRPQVALVLEGGGALGLAHVGVIRVIEELGIPVDIVVGTSMGAIVGGLYSIGYDADGLEGIALGSDWIDLFSEAAKPQDELFWDRLDRASYFADIDFDRRGFMVAGGLLSGRKILSYMDRLTIGSFAETDFDSLPRRFRAVAADIATGERVVLDRGSLADAMRASMSIPGVFAPYRLGGRYLVDGGVVDNLPIAIARSLGADLVIAVDLQGGSPFSREAIERSPVEALSRTLDIMVQSNVLPQLSMADLVLTVEVPGYSLADFTKGPEIVEIGRKTAESYRSSLLAFRALSGEFRKVGGSLPSAGSPPMGAAIGRVLARGGTDTDKALVQELFGPLAGTVPDEASLERAIAALDRTGLYETIRVQRLDEEPLDALSVRLKRKSPHGHSLRFGFSSATTYANYMTNSLGVSAGVVLRGLVAPGSRMTADVEILDQPAARVAFLQPLGSTVFTEAYFSARRDSDTYLSDTAIRYLYQTTSASVGFKIGVNPLRRTEIFVGASWDWIGYERIPTISAGADMDTVPLSRFGFSAVYLDSPILPVSGFYGTFGFFGSLPALGADRQFMVAETSGRVVPPLDIPFTVELSWNAASDFSERSDDERAAPAFYKPDLADRWLFPGPMRLRERIGSHALGFGATAKYQLNWASRAAGFPAFALAQAASGIVLQDSADVDRSAEFTHWNAAAGLGVRLSDSFGILLRGGVYRGFNEEFAPFFALDVGSFGY